MPAPQVVVIGAGPIGLETTAALHAAGVDVTCLDEGPVGGTIFSLFPPATRFFSSPERIAIAGIDLQLPTQEKATRDEYLAYLRSVVKTLALPVHTYQKVMSAQRHDHRWRIETRGRGGAKAKWEATHVVLAFGGTHLPRTLGVRGEELPHVDHFLGDPHRYFGRSVVIVGGKNSAAEAAVRCWRVGARVTLVHRGSDLHERIKYWIRPELVSLIKEGLVQANFNSTVERIESDHVIIHQDGQASRSLPAQDVLLMIGYHQDPALLKCFGIECGGPQQAPIFNPSTMETSVSGIFVAGTASAGTQDRFRSYIENAHIHADRITAAILGTPPPDDRPVRELPES